VGIVLPYRGPLRQAMKRFKRGWRKWRADVHLVSYPKCGRTWLVLLIVEALQRHHGLKRPRNPLKPRRMASRRRGIPYIHAHHDGGPEFLLPEEIPRDKTFYHGRNVIFLVRDPRDVLVSSYFQKAKRNYNYEGSMSEFLSERRGGLESILTFYNIWAANADVPSDFLMVAYEDLHTDAHAELRRVLSFLGYTDIDQAVIDAAVEHCRFDNMRQLERNDSYGTGALSPRDTNDVATYKTRQGKAGGYRDHLDADQIAWVDAQIRDTLDPYYARYFP
jgi:hypothetical protein